jgi:hypothetical protein
MGTCTAVNSGNMHIVLHVGSVNEFLPNAQLIYKAGLAIGDYHGQTNAKNFEKCVGEELTPNLAPQSVIVLDNSAYHCLQVDKPASI